jgi:hypothetical protein
METKELGFETVCELYPLLEPQPYMGDVLKSMASMTNQATAIGLRVEVHTQRQNLMLLIKRESKFMLR